eukprot:TRINITY_DN659_c2_g1_i5.p1 TRINITY_DN659_c2_g1~~TRINITY_DN659_c2_g1_i5.p1  ORF type:complete len:1089 (-),score=253.73 TRINITY_DN659_c2_g1_i5:2896-5955(-)
MPHTHSRSRVLQDASLPRIFSLFLLSHLSTGTPSVMDFLSQYGEVVNMSSSSSSSSSIGDDILSLLQSCSSSLRAMPHTHSRSRVLQDTLLSPTSGVFQLLRVLPRRARDPRRVHLALFDILLVLFQSFPKTCSSVDATGTLDALFGWFQTEKHASVRTVILSIVEATLKVPDLSVEHPSCQRWVPSLLRDTKAPATVRAAELAVLARMASASPLAVASLNEDVWSLCVSILGEQSRKKLPDGKLVAGCLESLSLVLSEYAPHDVLVSTLQYSHIAIQILAQKRLSRYDVPKAGLHAVARKCFLMKGHIFDMEWVSLLRGVYSAALHGNHDVRRSAIDALLSLISTITSAVFDHETIGVEEESFEMRNHVFEELNDLLSDAMGQLDEGRAQRVAAILLLGKMSHAIKEFEGVDRLEHYLKCMLEFGELLFSGDIESIDETLSYVSVFLEAFSEMQCAIGRIDGPSLDQVVRIIRFFLENVQTDGRHKNIRRTTTMAICKLLVSLSQDETHMHRFILKLVRGLMWMSTLSASHGGDNGVDEQIVVGWFGSSFSEIWYALLYPTNYDAHVWGYGWKRFAETSDAAFNTVNEYFFECFVDIIRVLGNGNAHLLATESSKPASYPTFVATMQRLFRSIQGQNFTFLLNCCKVIREVHVSLLSNPACTENYDLARSVATSMIGCETVEEAMKTISGFSTFIFENIKHLSDEVFVAASRCLLSFPVACIDVVQMMQASRGILEKCVQHLSLTKEILLLIFRFMERDRDTVLSNLSHVRPILLRLLESNRPSSFMGNDIEGFHEMDSDEYESGDEKFLELQVMALKLLAEDRSNCAGTPGDVSESQGTLRWSTMPLLDISFLSGVGTSILSSLDSLLPHFSLLTQFSADEETKLRAGELFHELFLIVLDKFASDITWASSDRCDCFRRCLECGIVLATDMNASISNMFRTLCHQTCRFLSKRNVSDDLYFVVETLCHVIGTHGSDHASCSVDCIYILLSRWTRQIERGEYKCNQQSKKHDLTHVFQ